jgi:transcriptional regulator with XRE-family HTH domain
MRNTFDAIKFSVTCKIWRNMNAFTVADMAQMNGMATSTYSFVENGDRMPTIAEFSHLCDTMGFEAKEFFKTAEKGR